MMSEQRSEWFLSIPAADFENPGTDTRTLNLIMDSIQDAFSKIHSRTRSNGTNIGDVGDLDARVAVGYI